MGVQSMRMKGFVCCCCCHIKRYFFYVCFYKVLSTRFCFSRDWKSAHSLQSEHTCNMLIQVFNCVPNFLYRSGCYDISFLPHAKFMHSGHSSNGTDLASSPEEDLHRCQSQHTLIRVNLGLNEAPFILSLDTPVQFHKPPDIRFPKHIVAFLDGRQPPSFPSSLTLRQVLLTIPYPTSGYLTSTAKQSLNSTDCLFHSIDLVQRSCRQPPQVTLASIVDCTDVAQHVLVALPSWVNTFFGHDALTT